ncbi:MAG: hypothetical protein HGB21_08350, partial [Nitrospirae bacterium]|nr:hypothetical protein [Nitrospirota bacterium]
MKQEEIIEKALNRLIREFTEDQAESTRRKRKEILDKVLDKLVGEFTEEQAEGAVIQVMGPVVDVEFSGRLPAINSLLRAGDKDTGLPLEAVQLLGEGIVRTIALDSSDALARGTMVFDTGMPISVPTGTEILG